MNGIEVFDWDPDDPIYWHFFAEARKWQIGEFDPLVRLIATHEVANVLIVHRACEWVLHPYDGGMDVFAERADTLKVLRTRFTEWLSPHPTGL